MPFVLLADMTVACHNKNFSGNQFQVGAEIFLFATGLDEIWGLLSFPNRGTRDS